jgi:hypothetical protein
MKKLVSGLKPEGAEDISVEGVFSTGAVVGVDPACMPRKGYRKRIYQRQ